MKKPIYGYYFAIIVEPGEDGYVAYAPGVGGVYEEGASVVEAQENAYQSACAILEMRAKHKEPILKNSRYIRAITELPTSQSIGEIKGVLPSGFIFTSPCGVSA